VLKIIVGQARRPQIHAAPVVRSVANGAARRLAGALLATAVAARVAEGATSGPVPEPQPDPAHVAAAVRLMSDLRAESARQAEDIRDAYAREVATLAFRSRRALGRALDSGVILALPSDAQARNVRPRLTGRHPIGEADLDYQPFYVAARPEAVGLLLEIASRVRSGPIEVTSLARHHEYQRRLARTNANARTAVPTHAMGLAFDISILNASLATAREIRDLLRRMAADGDLFFVAEQRQLVFHVVPAPGRRDHYAAVHEALIAAGAPRVPRPKPPPAPAHAELVALLADDPIPPAAAATTKAAAIWLPLLVSISGWSLSIGLGRCLIAQWRQHGGPHVARLRRGVGA
jgi:hypothetical protein